MAPKSGRGSTSAPSQQKGKGKGAGQEEHLDIIQFGLPQPVTSALQAISARSTAGLFRDAAALPSDQTAQQVAQSRANSLDRLNKRLNGNIKAKAVLRDAAQAWLGKFGQHLMALTDRLHNIAAKLDQDQNDAIEALQAATLSLAVDPQDQVQAALASLGPIWTTGQEAEVLRLASQLRAFSAVMPETQQGFSSGSGVRPNFGLLQPSRFNSLGDGPLQSSELTSPPATSMDVSTPEAPAKRRWSFRGSKATRPSKSPRRELILSAEPWSRVSTGLTPGRPHRGPNPADEEELIPATTENQHLTWVEAWRRVVKYCLDHGQELVGQLTRSEVQEASFPVITGEATEDAQQRSEAIWYGLPDLLLDNEGVFGAGVMLKQLRDFLRICRDNQNALPRLRQGSLLLALAVEGSLYGLEDFGPSTVQEWLFPAGILTQNVSTCRHIPVTWSSEALKAMVMLPCPFHEALEETTNEPDL